MRHNPRCAIFREPPGLQSDEDCNCGAIPPLGETVPRKAADDLYRTLTFVRQRVQPGQWTEGTLCAVDDALDQYRQMVR